MRAVLIAWVGVSDLKGPEKSGAGDLGPIAQALAARSFDQVVLLEFFDKADHQKLLPGYIAWLRERTKAEIVERRETLRGPTDFGGIYEAARRACQEVLAQQKDATLTFHLSPGSPPMAAVWVLLGKTIFPAELIESSREQGVKTAEVPFDIAAEFLPDLLREPDERLRAQSTADSPPAPEFKAIIHRSRVMARLIQRARRVALRNVPVLIEGESGTGKELLAKAIHQASPRKGKPFIAVNCGALPASLVESELFGVEKGAATGVEAREGYFEAADGGTLFLDELGELPLPVQVKLLRVLQENEVMRIGARKPKRIDVRIVAATNRTVAPPRPDDHAAGSYGDSREDGTYRRFLRRSIVVTALRTFEGGPQLHEKELGSFERAHGLSLPASYKQFLLTTNGGRPERDLLTIHGLKSNPLGRIHVFFGLKDPVESCNLDWNLQVFRDRIPASYLPIATTEGADKICLKVTGEHSGAIYYWDGYARAGERALYFLADDFASFIASLQKDELSPRMRAS